MEEGYTFLPPANEVCESYVFTPVCHSVHRGGSTWAGTALGRSTPPGKYIPQAGTPPGQVHPQGRYTTWAGIHPHPLGRYIPLGRCTPWVGTPLGQVHAQGRYTPPQTVHAGTRSTSRWYASYWDAFLSDRSILLTLDHVTNTHV